MIYSHTLGPKAIKAIGDASHTPFWLDDPAKPTPEPPLTLSISTDLLIIVASFAGLWTALLAKEENPNRDVVLLEAGETGIGASGRNGGFMDASITHGFLNGQARWPLEIRKLHKLGINNLAGLEETIARLGIECDYHRTGEIDIATEPYLMDAFIKTIELAKQYDIEFHILDRYQIQAVVKSPIFLGGIKRLDSSIVNPAQLAWGLRKACLDFGGRPARRPPRARVLCASTSSALARSTSSTTGTTPRPSRSSVSMLAPPRRASGWRRATEHARERRGAP